MAVVFALSLVGALAFSGQAQEIPAKKVSLQPEFKPYDISPTSKGALPTVKPTSGVKVSTGCKSDSGLTYATGEPGYDTCMAQFQMKASDPKVKDKKDGTGASVNFKFGE